ncbi:MAG TPA: laccase domain-containing protein, partial [Gammaproteobacteria bacterium]|nr:laccase domain-containing protein [Gammaproteobacteria bacterium]
MSNLDFIRPDWPAPSSVHAVSTTRTGGVSEAPYDSLNLGARTDDDPDRVRTNRARVMEALNLPAEPAWLAQQHGVTVVRADDVTPDETPADAVWSDRPGQVCAVLTA